MIVPFRLTCTSGDPPQAVLPTSTLTEVTSEPGPGSVKVLEVEAPPATSVYPPPPTAVQTQAEAVPRQETVAVFVNAGGEP